MNIRYRNTPHLLLLMCEYYAQNNFLMYRPDIFHEFLISTSLYIILIANSHIIKSASLYIIYQVHSRLPHHVFCIVYHRISAETLGLVSIPGWMTNFQCKNTSIFKTKRILSIQYLFLFNASK